MVTLAAVRDAAREFASGFDASLVPYSAATQTLKVAAELEAIAASITAKAAARVAESDSWRVAGAKTPAHRIASLTGTSLGEAMRTLTSGERLAEFPEIAAAAAEGRLSAAQQSLVTQAAAADPSVSGRMVALADRVSVAELRTEVAKVKARAVDPEARRAAINAERGLRHFTDVDGVGRIHIADNPEVTARFMAQLAGAREAVYRTALDTGPMPSGEALDWDALRGVVDGSAAAGTKVTEKVIVRVDYETLMRGHALDGEVCEIAGLGPIAVSAVTDALERGAFLAAVLTQAEQVAGVAHLGRGFTAKQRTAYEWAAHACSAQGCPRTRHLEADHPWGKEYAKTGVSVVEDTDPLGPPCHDLRTFKNWALVPGTGRRPLVPPDDPRHPKNQAAEKPPPAAA